MKQLSISALRRLPWPRAVWFSNKTLTGEDAYRVGELIVEQIYGGQRDTSRQRKPWSLRRLQAQVLTSTSPATLVRSIQTYETAKRLGLTPPWRHIETGHLVRVSQLPLSHQRRLLKAAETHGWSVQELAQRARRLRGRSQQGRRPTAAVVRAVEALNRRELLSQLNRIDELQPAARQEILERIAALQDELQTVKKELKKGLSNGARSSISPR